MKNLNIYCNAALPESDAMRLREGISEHMLILPAGAPVGVLGRGLPDARMNDADVVFGQPDADQTGSSARILWVQLTSAGYAAYDRADLRAAFVARGAALTKSSLVFDEPCALHLLAFMCAEARRLPAAFEDQRRARTWPQQSIRAGSRLLRGESVVVLGYGAIGRRLAELLRPLHMRVAAVRRHVVGNEGVPTYRFHDPDAVRVVNAADHVINILPASTVTERYFDAARIAHLKNGAVFYNIGRGTTVDQEALVTALTSGQLSAAYLDVTDPEPLPPQHPLWSAPNCFITPHTAGGHATESTRLVQHFLDNLARYRAGEGLVDRVF